MGISTSIALKLPWEQSYLFKSVKNVGPQRMGEPVKFHLVQG